jgi:glycosyltransferase involved in cell wall biosynthesis
MMPIRPSHKTIAYYCVDTRLDDAGSSLLAIVKRLTALSSGWYVPWVILPQDDGPLVDQLEALEIDYSVLPMPREFFPMSRSGPVRSFVSGALAWLSMRAYLSKLEKLVEQRQPALIQSLGLRCHTLSARLGADVPVVWDLRDILVPGTVRSMLRRQYLSAGAFLLSNSYATAMAFEPGNDKPWVVFPGIDTERFTLARNRVFRDEFRVSDDVPVIGTVGAIHPDSGLMNFVEMAAELRSNDVDARFVIAGIASSSGSQVRTFKASLERRIAELGLSDLVRFADADQNRLRMMQGLDYLVSGSLTAMSVGQELLQAMSCGVPVVATALGASLEVIEDRVNGRLVAPGDVQALSQAVYHTVLTNDLRQQYIACGRERVCDWYSMDRYVAAVIRVYDRVMVAR